MTQARIRRGGTSRLSVKGQGKVTARSRRGAVRQKPAWQTWLAGLPVSKALLRRLVIWLVVLAALAGLYSAASFFGLPAAARMELGELAARAGYQVKKTEIHGVERMDEGAVYAIALGQVDRSMLTIDIAKVRADIMRLPWVEDARISRRLPDTLVVDIVERKPAAVWQHEGRLYLIDADGAVLEPVAPDAMPDLPLIVGLGGNSQAPRLDRLMEAAPALKPVLAGATWVGNRRWDLRFQSGETLSLPEGDEKAAEALVSFARLDGMYRLLGRNIPRFDMRDPDVFVLRLPKEANTSGLPASLTGGKSGKDEKTDNTDADNASRGNADKAKADQNAGADSSARE
ncbi:MAG: FtsQ-type POTRA domain-containing protein [Sphingobium sp.]|nr:FtsQ-type POTRA domain-containing protein [Sphingobium sp.]